MTWITTAISAVRQRLGVSASPVHCRSKRRAGIYGPATPAETRAKRNVLLLSDIEILRAELRLAEKNHKRRTHIQRQIYSARHEILRNG